MTMYATRVKSSMNAEIILLRTNIITGIKGRKEDRDRDENLGGKNIVLFVGLYNFEYLFLTFKKIY